MKKLLSSLCFLFIFSCSGYEPIFSTKDMNFYIDGIENIDNEETTKNIIRNIRSYKLNDSKKNYFLKINSTKKNKITSRDSKGDPLTYRITIEVNVDVLKDDQILLLNTIKIKKEFIYNYQKNQFVLGQYKKDIIQSEYDDIKLDVNYENVDPHFDILLENANKNMMIHKKEDSPLDGFVISNKKRIDKEEDEILPSIKQINLNDEKLKTKGIKNKKVLK